MGSVARWAVVAFVACAVAGAEAPARAQEGFGYGAPVARSGDASLLRNRNRVWADLPFYTGGDSATDIIAFAPAVGARWRAAPAIEVGLDWGFPFATTKDTATGDSAGRFSLGNPYLGASWVDTGPTREIRVGAGLALPVAHVPSVDFGSSPEEVRDAGLAFLGYTFALAMWGLWNEWLYAPDTLSLVLPASIDAKVGHALRAGGSAALDVAFPVRDSGGSRSTDVFIQLDGYIGYQASESFGFGARLALVVAPTVDTDDRAQLSLEPYVSADLEHGFIRVGLLMNVDHPWGFAFDESKVWALRTTIGARF